MADPDIQIRRGGGGGGRATFWSKKGGPGGPSPGSATDIDGIITECARLKGTHLALLLVTSLMP